MIRKILLLFFLAISILPAQSLGPKITVTPIEYDFGDIIQGETVTHTFVITNAGWDTLNIAHVRASCGCTAANPQKNSLAPGESTNLLVSFNSTGRTGKQTKFVYIQSNDIDIPELRLTFVGSIKSSDVKSELQSKIVFPETQHDFGVVQEGKKVEYTFKFTNMGNGNLEIKDIKTSCGCTAALVSSEKLEPGQNGTLKIELDTTNRLGRMSRTITVTSNDPSEPQKILTIYAEVQKGS